MFSKQTFSEYTERYTFIKQILSILHTILKHFVFTFEVFLTKLQHCKMDHL